MLLIITYTILKRKVIKILKLLLYFGFHSTMSHVWQQFSIVASNEPHLVRKTGYLEAVWNLSNVCIKNVNWKGEYVTQCIPIFQPQYCIKNTDVNIIADIIMLTVRMKRKLTNYSRLNSKAKQIITLLEVWPKIQHYK